jgi:hypothetical protein
MQTRFEIVGGSNVGISTNIDTQRSINLYPHRDPQAGVDVMLPRSGLVKQVTASASPMRAEYTGKDGAYLYAVLGDKVFRYDAAFTESLISTPDLTTVAGYVGIADNNADQVFFADGVKGYIWDKGTTTWTIITAGGFPSEPTDAAFVDGYFLTFKAGTNEYFISALNNGLQWDALRNNGFLESRSDNIVAIRVLKRRIFIFGRENTEILQDIGGKDFPFEESQNEIMEFGCAAIGSAVRGYGRLFWLASNKNGTTSVMMSSGGLPVPISSYAVDYQISTYANPGDARAILYKENGHIFYELSFTEADRTWVADVTEEMKENSRTYEWYEAQELGGSRSRVDSHTSFINKNYVGNRASGNIYYFDAKTHLNDTDAIKRVRIPKTIREKDGHKIRINSLELQVKSGIGQASGDSSDPIVYMRFSKDEGVSYGSRLEANLGKIGERRARCKWRNLGTCYSFTPEFEFYQLGQFIITGMVINYDILK